MRTLHVAEKVFFPVSPCVSWSRDVLHNRQVPVRQRFERDEEQL